MKNIPTVLPPIILVLALATIYLGTLAPGLTWANGGTDGGDLIAAAATGGVAHPSGYPTYLLAAGLFQQLPLGTLAFRTNLLSGVAAVLAAVTVYAILVWLPNSPARGNWLAGSVAALMFGLAPLVWSQAVITEVYTLHALLVALVLALALWIPSRSQPARWDALLGATLGLALGSHLTSIFLLPALLRGKLASRWKPDLGALARGLAGMTAGLLVYAALPLRALSQPPVNWGNPVTLERLTWLVSGELYQRRLLELPLDEIGHRLESAGQLLFNQFGLVGTALALMGLIFFFKPIRIYILTLFTALAFTSFAVLYGSADSYLYLIPVVLCCAFWIGLGLGGLFQTGFSAFHWVRPLLALLFGLLLAVTAVERWSRVDASRDDRAEAFGARVMADAPHNALLVAEDDAAVFGLWYFHFALRQRPDLVVMARDLLHFDWYDQSLRAAYPGVRWPEGLFWAQSVAAANPGRAICAVSQAQLSCAAP